MKQILTFLICCCVAMVSYGQVCTPDTTHLSDSMIIAPNPYRDDLPGSGITKKACINTPYELVFSVKVPVKITVPVFGELEINYVQLLGIEGLPAGLNYTCRSTDCKMYKNTYDCMIISGTPDATNAPGKHPIKINFKINTALFGDVTYSFPDPNLARGTYDIEVLPEGSSECFAGTKDITSDLFEVTFTGRRDKIQATLISDSELASAELLIFNNGAQKLAQQQIDIRPGKNEIELTPGLLAPGMYFYLISTRAGMQSGRFFITD